MQKSCFLFGHADTPQSILPVLEHAIEIEVSKGISTFYVGYHGNFDHLAASALRSVKQSHSEITILLLLAYHPSKKAIEAPPGFDGTFYPPIETVPYRYALIRANQHIIKAVDCIICYVRHLGNAKNLLALAEKQKKTSGLRVKNLATEMVILQPNCS